MTFNRISPRFPDADFTPSSHTFWVGVWARASYFGRDCKGPVREDELEWVADLKPEWFDVWCVVYPATPGSRRVTLFVQFGPDAGDYCSGCDLELLSRTFSSGLPHNRCGHEDIAIAAYAYLWENFSYRLPVEDALNHLG